MKIITTSAILFKLSILRNWNLIQSIKILIIMLSYYSFLVDSTGIDNNLEKLFLQLAHHESVTCKYIIFIIIYNTNPI